MSITLTREMALALLELILCRLQDLSTSEQERDYLCWAGMRLGRALEEEKTA